ncbi:MAG: rRNA maturation RNase YbeY [bacterium]|nr:rRNA maturation RNase YbeY [bacterium]
MLTIAILQQGKPQSNKKKLKINQLRQIIKDTLKYEGVRDGELSVVLGEDALLRRLNKEYRGIDKPTDVLTFDLGQICRTCQTRRTGLTGPTQKLGEIIISLDAVNRQAEEYNHSFEKELTILLIHGLLHLLGYDHSPDNLPQEQMAILTNKILAQLAIDKIVNE